MLRYERFDVEKYAERAEAANKGNPDLRRRGLDADPVASSYVKWHVLLPGRLALASMSCILIYEILVGVSMGVRKLRFVMVQWLMHLLLAINVALLIALAIVVIVRKYDIRFGALMKLGHVNDGGGHGAID